MVYCEFEGVAGYVKNEQKKQDANKKMEDGRKLSSL